MTNLFCGRRSAAWLIMSALAAAVPAAYAADAYPCQVLRIVSPYPAGGTTDILARLIGPGLSKGLGVPVIVDNKAGASSNIGTESVVRSQADGCTALLGNNTGIVINRNLYKLKYEPTRDLTAVGLVASTPLLLYVNAEFPAKSVAELVDLLKKSPGKYSYASGGSGSPQHLLGEMIKIQKSVFMVHIPYRGQGPAQQDVLGGTVPIAFETITALTPQLKSPRIRVLATTSAKRDPKLPEVPTMNESGFTDFAFENWYGLFVPSKTPAPVVERLSQELQKVLRSPEVTAKLAELGSRDVSGTPAQAAKFIAKELPQWEAVVKRSGATVD
ncbi:tripartite tricarboxylate transporter substrate binding protein [Aquincola sp. S2]|uniref:Tripartite tricarboxylate transporter substrate binding protein n=1 Tax=Pseudaquabacterium terrae TaxID=2732868 RepID=A0ABX2EPN4_9BURK|nr:tripartite tricarboxylate transporter substrate binding protein [Aquabacterium terrae]NRF70543.1 tripartite tricarboxylate transporter substrate binding protein [Aquabacterium terrae]